LEGLVVTLPRNSDDGYFASELLCDHLDRGGFGITRASSGGPEPKGHRLPGELSTIDGASADLGGFEVQDLRNGSGRSGRRCGLGGCSAWRCARSRSGRRCCGGGSSGSSRRRNSSPLRWCSWSSGVDGLAGPATGECQKDAATQCRGTKNLHGREDRRSRPDHVAQAQRVSQLFLGRRTGPADVISAAVLRTMQA
jgi:hypothetical protein